MHLFLILLILPLASAAQDTVYVHFLYGSKPARAFRTTERKWFGGILGGHVGVTVKRDSILNFCPSGKAHIFQHQVPNSHFALHDETGFYSIMGGRAEEMKRAVVAIPITTAQRRTFDSLLIAYRQRTPYDYALFGMRCGAAAYDVLAQMGLLTRYSISHTWKLIFYPRKLRKRLFQRADVEAWRVEKREGTARRIWERDRP